MCAYSICTSSPRRWTPTCEGRTNLMTGPSSANSRSDLQTISRAIPLCVSCIAQRVQSGCIAAQLFTLIDQFKRAAGLDEVSRKRVIWGSKSGSGVIVAGMRLPRHSISTPWPSAAELGTYA